MKRHQIQVTNEIYLFMQYSLTYHPHYGTVYINFFFNLRNQYPPTHPHNAHTHTQILTDPQTNTNTHAHALMTHTHNPHTPNENLVSSSSQLHIVLWLSRDRAEPMIRIFALRPALAVETKSRTNIHSIDKTAVKGQLWWVFV